MKPPRTFACPHCGGDIEWFVQSLVEEELRDATYSTSFADCDSCGKGYNVSVGVDVEINGRSFEEDHPDIAQRLAGTGAPLAIQASPSKENA